MSCSSSTFNNKIAIASQLINPTPFPRKISLLLRVLEKIRSYQYFFITQYLLVISVPFLFFTVVFLIWDQADPYFPYSQISSCFLADMDNDQKLIHSSSSVNVSIIVALIIILIEHLFFAFSIFKLRYISDQFSITQQLKLVYLAWGLSGFCSTLLVTFIKLNITISWTIYTYFYAVRNFLLFSVSVASPVRKSFHSSNAYSPRQTKFCAQNFRIASCTHLPTLFFNNFLKIEYASSGHLMFQLFMDIRIFQNLDLSASENSFDTSFMLGDEEARANEGRRSTPLNRDSINQVKSKAVEIFQNYLAHDAPFRVKLQKQKLIAIERTIYGYQEDIQLNLFDQIMEMLYEKLEDYYSQFKRQEKYTQLLRELEMREIQHSVLVRLKMLPQSTH